ncbi:hypothetical protein LCGC14_2980760 [marine sediment metagenome]|uniref:Uncharacterized protein n=1 Tax=marine sediment metagenome TaxID=412755 RepID=A0A0F8ZXV7_9ZZZZ
MCRIRERELENQLKINAEEINRFEQKLLSSLSTLHKMRHSQAELQALLHEESRERLTQVIKPKKRGGTRIPKSRSVAYALLKLKFTPKMVEEILLVNPGWRTKEVRI